MQQYKPRVGSDLELLQAIHEIFARLDLMAKAFGQFGNELALFQDTTRGFGNCVAIIARLQMVPNEYHLLIEN
ncbi:hypothetical protein CK203_029159 [Vitis vinifera]|uniref:Uncharacterized protein n=1 Tax=Vitis vinifera TaxID=29760 RepID=A0A438ISS2_VITVI|nr:hypothetical protein CK203_029159 [Vitis vinifera]